MSEMNGAPVDLGAFTPSDTADLHVKSPADPTREIGWVVTFAGPSHPKTVALNNEVSRDALRRAKEIELSRVNGRKWKGDGKDVDTNRREFVEGIVSRIITWTPVELDGKRYEFEAKSAVELLLNPKMGAFVAQFVDFLTEDRSFMKDSATT